MLDRALLTCPKSVAELEQEESLRWTFRVPHQNVPSGVLPIASHGQGVWVYDETGRAYLDGCSGAIVCNLGHGNPAIVEAQAAQSRQISFAFSGHMESKPKRMLRETILSRCNAYAEVLFFNSGSEAIEAAVRASRIYWIARGLPTKTHILSRTISYHGITEGALRLSGHNERRQVLPANQLSQPLVSTSYCFRCPFKRTPATCDTECASDLDNWIDRIGSSNIAAFLFEPVVGASGGAIGGPAAYFQKIRQITSARDVLLIADEVMTGFGRIGSWLGLDRWGISADLVVVGKGLGAGYTPISALLISPRVWETISSRPDIAQRIFGHTYGGNPASCATALAVINQIEEQRVFQNVVSRGPQLHDLLHSIAAEFPTVIDVRGEGLLWGLELDARNAAQALASAALRCGLLVYPCTSFLGVGLGEAILVAPPLNSSSNEIVELGRRLRMALATYQDWRSS